MVDFVLAEPIKTPSTPLEVLSEQVEKKFEAIDKAFKEIEKKESKSASKSYIPVKQSTKPEINSYSNIPVKELIENISVPISLIKSKAGDKVLFQNNARAVPYYSNGIVIGLRLFAIPSDSLCYDLKLLTGDIIQEIDGEKVGDPTKFYSTAYEKLTSSNPTTFLVLRKSQRERIKMTVSKE